MGKKIITKKKTINNPDELQRKTRERIQQEQKIIDEKQPPAPPEPELATDQDDQRRPYFTDEDGYLCRTKRTRDGSVKIRLCNFDARITAENVVDDGLETKTFYTLEGQLLHDGHSLPKIEIPSNSFAGMNWCHQYGTRAVLEAGATVRDFVRHRIQVASRDVRRQVYYGHTGWRHVEGKDVYLHAGGAIGGGCDVNIRLPKELLRYELPPAPPENSDSEKKALEASLSFLDIGKHAVTLPLFCGIYLAPLTTLLDPMPNFSLYLYGSTGTFKSTLAVLGLAHFGSFTGVETLSNLDDSVASLEKRLFILKDELVVIDDFYPSQRKIDAEGMALKVQRLIRSQSNRTSRSRLNPDLSEKARHEPRGMLLFTAEELPGLESTLGRISVIEVTDGAVDKKKLTDLQHNLPLLSMAMSAYIAWLRENLQVITKAFPERFIALRELATREGLHKKLPEQAAFLRFALETVLSWMTDRKVLTNSQASELIEEGWSLFRELAEKQQQRIRDDDPVKLFTDILGTLTQQNKVRIKHTQDDGEDLGAGTLIGFYDTANIYLYPTAAWHELQFYLQKESGHFPFSRNTFLQMLRNRKIIQGSPNGENTTIVWIQGKSHRVLKIIDRVIYQNTVRTVRQEEKDG